MSQLDPILMFDKAHAEKYDTKFARAEPFRDVIHLVTDLAFASLPERDRKSSPSRPVIPAGTSRLWTRPAPCWTCSGKRP